MAASQYQPIVSFVAGELSPELRGRFDIQQYRQGCQTALNMMCLQFGGAKRRPGTIKLQDGLSTSARSRLIPFVLSRSESYVLEVNDASIRIHDVSTKAIVVTIPSPFPSGACYTMDYAQAEATMIFADESMTPHRLVKTGGLWGIGRVPFIVQPTGVYPERYNASSFTPASSGAGGIVVFTGTPRGGSINMTISQGSSFGKIVSIDTGAGTFNVQVEVGFDPSSTESFFLSGPYFWTLTFAGDTELGKEVTITNQNSTFTTGDVGSTMAVNGGRLLLTERVNSTTMKAEVIQELISLDGATGSSFALERPTWGDVKGYPRAVTFHEQRLLFAGWPGEPKGIVASALGIPFDFRRSDLAEDGYSYTMRTRYGTAIEYLVSDAELVVFTDEGEYALLPSNDQALSKENLPRARRQGTHGVRRVRPILVNSEPVFVRASGDRAIAMSYDGGSRGYAETDISILAEHLFGSPVIDMAYLRKPTPIVFCVLENGKAVCCTYDRTQSVTAWWRWETDGFIQSVTAVPNNTTDELYMSVKRNVTQQQFIERVLWEWYPREDDEASGNVARRVEMPVDCAVVTDFAGSGGLSVPQPAENNNLLLWAVADGFDAGAKLVSNDELTLDFLTTRVAVGYGYEAKLEPMPPEQPTQAGTGQGRPVRAGPTEIKLLKSAGGLVNGNPLRESPSHSVTSQSDPIEYFSGQDSVDLIGWTKDQPTVSIEQNRPYPMHVTFIVQRLGNAP